MKTEQSVFQHQFENGLRLVAEPMPWLQSAAFSFRVPAGCQYDPSDRRGVANFTCEMVQRGAGKRSSREFVEYLESLGVNYGSSAGIYNSNYGGAVPANRLFDALSVFADVIRRPTMPEDQFEDGRLVCYQEIQSIEDDLAQKSMIALRARHFGDPAGRHCEGTMESVASISMEDVRSFYESHYRPNDMIIAVAGNIQWPQLKDKIGELFEDWEPKPTPTVTASPPQTGMHHIDFDSNQTHIALAWPTLSYDHPDYYLARCAIGILSDGMSSRLFREVREKRGLCYTVFASCSSILNRGSVIGYCGTSTERAQESLDVMIAEIHRLYEGVTERELAKLKVQFRSRLIMSQESSRAKAGNMAGDVFYLGRTRSIDEINQIINQMTADDISQFLAKQPVPSFDVVTLGKHSLDLNDAVSTTSA